MSLSSLIVQREVATMRQVEEALARQVIYGGDLVTNLLEVARVDEAVLTQLLAESTSLAPAPAGELPSAPEAVRTLVPLGIVTSRNVVPLEVLASGKLVIAVAEPLPSDVEEQLRVALGRRIEQRVAPAVRVQEAISRAYGVPLDRRAERLVARLARLSGGESMPPQGSPSMAPAPARTNTSAVVVGRLVTNPPNRSKTASGFPAVSAGSAAEAPAPSPAASAAPQVARSTGSSEARGLLQRETSPNQPAVRRRRGPLTAESAKHEAGEAEDRDALLDLFFDFSRQFFDYSAVFLVHGDIAEGRDAFGSGATRERVLGIGVPLDIPSLFSTVREKRATIVAKPAVDGLDAVLLADLHRAKESEVALVPLVVRTRAVAILIGDCGEAGIDRGSVQQVTAFSGMVGKALERIIVRRKLDGFIAGGSERAVGRARASAAASKAPPPVSAAPPAAPVDPIAMLVRARARISSAPPPAKQRMTSTRVPPHTGSGLPPPAANVAVVRKISGPPIPREEPASSGIARVVVQASPSKVSSRSPSAASPQLEVVHLEVQEVDDAESARALFDELGWDGSTEPPPPLPASAAIAVPAHAPPAPAMRRSVLPTVMVEDLDRELVAAVDRLASGEVDEQAEGELLEQGERAVRAMMSRFPGPVTFPRERMATAANPPRPSECGPILRLVARQRRVALPFVLDRLTAVDPEVRGWATHMLMELPYVEAIPRLLPLLRDTDSSTRVSAALALAAVARAAPEAVQTAAVELARGADPSERLTAIAAMSKLRLAPFVPDLVRALGDGNDSVVSAAHDALVQVTRQDFGTDARPWLKWWETNSSRHRIEWLIDALVHEVAEIRRAAGEELRTLSKEYFGYAGDLPPRDRDRAQQRYRDWWLTEGRGRFRRA